ncbi:MAG: MogA/MoaB family molybdenum cofactor biosynthesis protein [Oscillatoriaceae bacterium SKW80]|nr:MogA/MoaB family molybdenum cofactor biosynthesis protein [Oscillatoriaceae bacterium SKYG93]MCX8121433.1 MogA/MoaB family molybdenum cofactor biosynthesis protein [Oscillatoriaceae bacterium SKW80]MDW8451890.1 MogA/MoaB family molybdenum cofactor biosynthesis protein [Oscillatoriaceae cyanobacterium SKYGB_i_bin93]HIK29433.1 MogA/MoaB family molybdenum cofactor biosynthesis protein [Oscillatoriaceae cyanobacterium M7585_C2015_266]
MRQIPSPKPAEMTVNCAVVTVSDTRNPETDSSGQLIQQCIESAGHRVTAYTIVKDEPESIQALLQGYSEGTEIDVLIFNGGTGIAPRDTTYDALAGLLEKTLPGFGELFRFLSYQEIGTRAMASRACAGIYRNKLIFSLPGSPAAVKLAMEKLIIPEMVHLVNQMRKSY